MWKSIGLFYVVILVGILTSSCEEASEPDTITFVQTYGGEESDIGTSVRIATDGGYVITGYYTKSYAQSGRDVTLIKTDAHGN